MLFSQRAGLKPAKKAIQRESLDVEARNALWSVLWPYLELYWREVMGSYGFTYPHRREFEILATQFWTRFFKGPVDLTPEYSRFQKDLRTFFYNCAWNECLDVLEFAAQHLEEKKSVNFAKQCNVAFEAENCAYRFAGGLIVPSVSEAEIDAIDQGIANTTPLVSEHLAKALRFLTDRKAHDYQNSIKESISALEAATRNVSGNKNAVLTDALKTIHKRHPLHPALFEAVKSLYGYAGDESGIRHAAKESGTNVTQAEARLILVICASVSSFLTSRTA